MSVVAKQRKRGPVYFVVTKWKKRQYWERVGTDKREADRLDARRKKEVRAKKFKPPQLTLRDGEVPR
jgi:hypothetical protein